MWNNKNAFYSFWYKIYIIESNVDLLYSSIGLGSKQSICSSVLLPCFCLLAIHKKSFEQWIGACILIRSLNLILCTKREKVFEILTSVGWWLPRSDNFWTGRWLPEIKNNLVLRLSTVEHRLKKNYQVFRLVSKCSACARFFFQTDPWVSNPMSFDIYSACIYGIPH